MEAEGFKPVEPKVVQAAWGEDKISPFWTTPVGEWFNIGKDIVGEDGKPMGESLTPYF